MATLSKAARYLLEQTKREESRAVLAQIQRIEQSDASPADKQAALLATKWGLQKHREETREYYRGVLAEAKQKWLRDFERKAGSHDALLRRLQLEINGMTDDEVQKRAESFYDAEAPDPIEVDLVCSRLRQMGGQEPTINMIRDNARARHAWEPWAREGAGKEAVTALDELETLGFGEVVIELDGEPAQVATIDALVDLDRTMT